MTWRFDWFLLYYNNTSPLSLSLSLLKRGQTLKEYFVSHCVHQNHTRGLWICMMGSRGNADLPFCVERFLHIGRAYCVPFGWVLMHGLDCFFRNVREGQTHLCVGSPSHTLEQRRVGYIYPSATSRLQPL